MGTLFRAEWQKMVGNRWLTGCLIWSWALAAGTLSLLIAFAALVHRDTAELFVESPSRWTDASLFFWAVPNSIIGRLLIVGFTAALFGGEYQWGTWKNLLPRRGRIPLILMKFLTLGVFVVLAFGLTSIIWTVGLGLVQLAAGAPYPPALDAIPPRYGTELLTQIFVAFISTLIIGAVAALVALVTRSILASVIGGIFVTILDGAFAAMVIILFLLTDVRFFPSLFRYTISYNVDNLIHWAGTGTTYPVLGNVQGTQNPIVRDIVVDPPIAGNSVAISGLILLIWMAALVGLSVWSFYRQDLTEV